MNGIAWRSLPLLLLLVGGCAPAGTLPGDALTELQHALGRAAEPAVARLVRGDATGAAAALLALHQRRRDRPALYWAGWALLAAGQRSSGLERLLQLLLAGPGPGFAEAAALLAEDPVFPLAPAAMDHLPAVPLATLAPRVRAGLEHRLALHLLRRGEPGRAAALLARWTDRPEALYLRAVALLRRGMAGEARRCLERCWRLADGERAAVGHLARLALARLAGEAGDLRGAVRHYAAVPFGSPHFAWARQELAWIYLRAGDPARALAQSVVLRAPALGGFPRLDGAVVEAGALLGLCRPREGRGRVQQAIARLTAGMERLSDFLRTRPEVRLYYVEAMASAAGRSRALSGEAVAVLLADASFRRVVVTLRELQRERGRLLHPDARGLQALLSRELDERLGGAQEAAGRTVQGLLAGQLAELRELRQRAREVLFDAAGRSAREAVREGAAHAAARPSTRDAASGAGESSAAGPARGVRWPFADEYWSDEVPFIEVRLPSSCP